MAFHLALTIGRVLLASSADQRVPIGEGPHFVGYTVSGRLLLGPPLLLLALWLWARLASRPAT
jgi:hypothetical protein